METLEAGACLPNDLDDALLVGRVWRPAPVDGPCVVVVRGGQVFDVTAAAPVTADLFDREDPVAFAREAPGEALGPACRLVADSLPGSRAPARPRLLAPCDVQAIKACGVTFIASLMERLIEERIGGSASQAGELRETLQRILGTDLGEVRPGTPAARRLKEELTRRKLWSPYLEVGIGEDAEVFTKAQPMSAVGFGSDVGVLPGSDWNNPEAEIVLVADRRGRVVGATLGNDVNLRDMEGRSALLLGKAKDNNASCAIGPFVRLLDERYTMDSVRDAPLTLSIEGEQDAFALRDAGSMREIARDPLDLVAQTCGPQHQYPDGFVLFLGTMFAPVQDRGAAGEGFTHRLGDRVAIGSPGLGMLVNTVRLSTEIDPWAFGVRSLYRNLLARGVLA